MSRFARLLAGTLLAGVGVLVLVLGSAHPLPDEAPSQAVLLLDWRLRGEEAGPCLGPSAEESEDLPAHMRNPDACAGELPPYRLLIRMDGKTHLDERVRGGGARRDRPLTVYRQLELPPGRHRVEIHFQREDPDPAATELSVADTLEVAAGEVVLAVRRQDSGELELRSPVR